MDLKSFFEGKSLFQFKTFAAVKLTTSKSERKIESGKRTTISRRKLTPNGKPQNGNILPINKTGKNQLHKHKNEEKVNKDGKTQTAEEKKERNEKDLQRAYIKPDIDAATKTGSSTTKAAGNMADLLPRNTHCFVFLFTLVFRVWYVSRKKNWWILHPDEIYQTLEGNVFFFFLDSRVCGILTDLGPVSQKHVLS